VLTDLLNAASTFVECVATLGTGAVLLFTFRSSNFRHSLDLVDDQQVPRVDEAHRVGDGGASPGGTVEARARCLRGELAEAIYVLVIEGPRRPHVSLHHSREEAETAFQRLVGDSTSTEPRWFVSRRTFDDRDA
jgi:hypothetical protein